MKRLGWFLMLLVAGTVLSADTPQSLLVENFDNLSEWTPTAALREAGGPTLLPQEQAVLIRGKDPQRDSAIVREIAVEGAGALAFSVEIRHGYNTGAGVILTPLDENGQAMRSITPFKIRAHQSDRWDRYATVVDLPAGTTRLRIALGVLKGEIAFRRLSVRVAEKQQRRKEVRAEIAGAGFQVERFEMPRPIWEIATGQLQAGGETFVVGCDVDGRIGISPASSFRWTPIYDAGALAFDFAFADVDGDGNDEILFSLIDAAAPLTAINRQGRVVRQFEAARGPCKIRAWSDKGNAASLLIAVKQRSGRGAILMNRTGAVLWRTDDRTAGIDFARLAGGREVRLVVSYGGPRLNFWLVDKTGNAQNIQTPDARRLFNNQIRAADLDGDGADELVVLRGRSDTAMDCVCCVTLDGKKRWETPMEDKLQGSFGFLEVGDFISEEKGLETVAGGSHVLFVLNAQGVIRHQSSSDRKQEGSAERQWDPGRILIPDLTVERGKPDRLWAASSRLRDRAVYRLTFGRKAPFLRDFPIPDDEAHLDALAESVRKATAQASGAGKFKVIYTRGYFGRMSRAEVLELYRALRAKETANLEYVLMYDASDLMSHPRGSKFSTEQIIDDARWMEANNIPFGYFAVHGGEIWLSDRAIEGALNAAPRMFRFVYAAENMEGIYTPKAADFLPWCERMLRLLAPRGKHLLLKEKHDSWATTISDPVIRAALFDPKLRRALVPIWATNQPFHPEAQFGGMLALKASGWVEEFGMSTQYWNWGEWDQRDVNLAQMAPADITLRLELLGAALGAQWLHIEGGQPYMTSPPNPQLDPMAKRHRDLVYELIRKGLLRPNPALANVNDCALLVQHHPYYDELRKTGTSLKSFKSSAGPSPLRDGFLPVRQMLEPWPKWAFGAVAYGQRWHVETCFPKTPLGWVLVAQEKWPRSNDATWIETDSERVRLEGGWTTAREAQRTVEKRFRDGAQRIPVRAAGVCMVLQRLDGAGRYRAILLDPGYLAPESVRTTLECSAGRFQSAQDAVTGQTLPFENGRIVVEIPRGAFRIVDVQIR
ncbi:MAG: hypothetical protein N3B01_01935 [Verrucomicrobiae bacterium]|nr:hypothetical protein [Verrucomicrobiae bacterium]